ncbi:MAG: hypothetical protein ACRD35_01310, partial [Candidatus Acidiferrales bacterium]
RHRCTHFLVMVNAESADSFRKQRRHARQRSAEFPFPCKSELNTASCGECLVHSVKRGAGAQKQTDMPRRIASLAVALVLSISTSLCAQTELQRAGQMLQELYQQVHVAAEATLREGRQPEYTWQDYNRRLLPIQAVVNQGIVSALNRQPRPSAQDLENELRDVLGFRNPDAQLASAFSFQTSSRKVYVAAYALGIGATSTRSWIGVFGPLGLGNPYALLASVENSLPDKIIALHPLNDPEEQGLTFLAYGINWGDAHNRLTVIAYSFDGHKLKPIWSRADLPQGQIRVEGTKIKLTFLSSLLGPGYKSVREITEIYRVTSSSIELEKRFERPRG